MGNSDHIRYQFSPEYKNISPDMLEGLPKVVLTHGYDGQDNPVFVEDLPNDYGRLLTTPDKIASLRRKLIPATVTVPTAEALEHAIMGGATRLRGGESLIDDVTLAEDDIVPGALGKWVRDRHIPVEIEDMEQLSLLYQMGFTCVIDPGLVTVAEKMGELVEQGFRLEELLDLTLNAIDAAFIPYPQRIHILYDHILPSYEEMADPDFTKNNAQE